MKPSRTEDKFKCVGQRVRNICIYITLCLIIDNKSRIVSFVTIPVKKTTVPDCKNSLSVGSAKMEVTIICYGSTNEDQLT